MKATQMAAPSSIIQIRRGSWRTSAAMHSSGTPMAAVT
jgi:hypothetical protein